MSKIINGMAFRIKTEDKDGNLTNVETIYFASFRKCPELAELAKESAKNENELTKNITFEKITRKRLDAMVEAMASEEEVNSIFAALASLNEKIAALNDAQIEIFRKLVRVGLAGAGYEESDIDRYASYIDLKMLPTIISYSKMGAGRVDFF